MLHSLKYSIRIIICIISFSVWLSSICRTTPAMNERRKSIYFGTTIFSSNTRVNAKIESTEFAHLD